MAGASSSLQSLLTELPPSTGHKATDDALTRVFTALNLIAGGLDTHRSAFVTSGAGFFVGAMVNVFTNAGVATAQLANANTPTLADGVVTALQGNTAIVQFRGSAAYYSGLTPGAVYYLSNTPGQIALAPGTTNQKVGKAVSANTLMVSL